MNQLIAAGGVDRVEESRAATGPELGDAGLEFVLVIGVVLRNVGGDVKAHGEGQICLRANHLLQKLDRGRLLELETLADRCTGINHDADAQRQVCLLGEIENLGGRLLVIQQGEIPLLQILNEPSVLVGDGKDQVHLIDVGPDGETAVVLSHCWSGHYSWPGARSRERRVELAEVPEPQPVFAQGRQKVTAARAKAHTSQAESQPGAGNQFIVVIETFFILEHSP